MEQWEKNYYISAIAGASNGSSLVIMSKGLFFRHCVCVCVSCACLMDLIACSFMFKWLTSAVGLSFRDPILAAVL